MSRKIGNKKSRSKNKNRKAREKRKQSEYKEKIVQINEKLRSYFSVFGHRGYEYNNMLTNIEKMVGNDFSIFINHGSTSNSARLNLNFIYAKDKRKSRTRITKIFNFVSNLPDTNYVVKNIYGYNDNDKKILESIKALSALKKLENDALPNYYASLDAISNSNIRLKMRGIFSDKLKGKKKDSKEFEEAYNEIANQITEYLKEQSKQAENIVDRLQSESVFDDYLNPVTISDLLKR